MKRRSYVSPACEAAGRLVLTVLTVVTVGWTTVEAQQADSTGAPGQESSGERGDADVVREVRQLLEEIADAPPLHQAASRGDAAEIDRLVAAGADVDARDRWGNTPLHRAAAGGRLLAARRLLDAGADLDSRNDDGETPLHEAHFRNQVEVVELLIRAGAPALDYFRSRARDGDAVAPMRLAQMYLQGLGVEEDPREAYRWALRGARGSYVPARILLADVLTRGPLEFRDGAEALAWLRKAAADADPELQPEVWYRIGSIHAEGIGVERNPSEARRWLRRAAEEDHHASLYALGLMDVRGSGDEANAGRGVRRLERAARLGNRMAPLVLGVSFLRGQFVEADRERAYLWFTVAAAVLPEGSRRDKAEETLTMLQEALSARQIEQTRTRAEEWIQRNR